jgi:hypothetical protein
MSNAEGLTALTEALRELDQKLEHAEKQIQSLHQPGAIGARLTWPTSNQLFGHPLSG